MTLNSMQDHGPFVIGGSSVSPALVDTDFGQEPDKTWRDEPGARKPLKRLATADQIGAAALAIVDRFHCCADCIIAIDGSWPLA